MRLIDADAIKYTARFTDYADGRMTSDAVITKCEIDSMPTIDPVKHGRWVDRYGDGDWHCTRCGASVEKHEQVWRNWYFCYHCGAKMNGDEE